MSSNRRCQRSASRLAVDDAGAAYPLTIDPLIATQQAKLTATDAAAGDEFGIGWEYLASIHLVETRMGRIRGTSSAGAQGPMQFMPGTWAQYGEGDIEDPRDAIRAAARYLRASGAPGDMDRALFAYNRSDAYVRAISTYAAQMRADERLYRGYWWWQVYYRHVDGDRLLPVGYDGTAGG